MAKDCPGCRPVTKRTRLVAFEAELGGVGQEHLAGGLLFDGAHTPVDIVATLQHCTRSRYGTGRVVMMLGPAGHARIGVATTIVWGEDPADYVAAHSERFTRIVVLAVADPQAPGVLLAVGHLRQLGHTAIVAAFGEHTVLHIDPRLPGPVGVAQGAAWGDLRA